MRLVPNLSEITECPNCGSIHLYAVVDRFTFSKYFICRDCREEIYQGNIASTISISAEEAKVHTIKTDNEETARQQQEEKDKFLFNLREEIDNLKWHARTVEDAILMDHLSLIFTQIADYIENH